MSVAGEDPAGQTPACAEATCTLDAGKDTDGAPIQVLREYLGRPTDEAFPCDAYRWVRQKGKSRQVLVNLCNDGYGVAMVGSDHIVVDGPRFTWTQSGGSNWRGAHSHTVDLRSWNLDAEAHQTQFMGGNLSGEVRVDHLRHRAEVRWWGIDCAAADPLSGTQPDFLDPWTSRLRYAPIPVLLDPPAHAETMDPGTCGVRASGDGLDGYVTHGPVTAAPDATLRALLVGPTTLVVAVDDDLMATPKDPSRWVADDHLEIWAAPQEGPLEVEEAWDRWLGGAVPYQSCPAKPEPMVQWGVRLRDGAVFTGVGTSRSAPRASVAAGPAGGQLVRVELPFVPARLSVVYSDADGDRGQEQLIATSALRFNVADTVGFRGPGVRCDVDGERLLGRMTTLTPTDPARPVLGD